MEITYSLRVAPPAQLTAERAFHGLTFAALMDKLNALQAELGVFGTVRITREREVSER